MATDLDSDFMSIEKAGYCIHLSSKDEPYVLHQDADLFLSKSKHILVYAECIELSTSLILPGKHIALVCHELRLSGSDHVVIDVSGSNGGAQIPSPVGNGAVGEDGKDAGKVFISVEIPTKDLDRLTVRAYGGDGGQGGSTSDLAETCTAGKGGKGGVEGKITVLFNQNIHETRRLLGKCIREAKSATWYAQVTLANDIITQEKLPTNLSLPSIKLLLKLGSSLEAEIPDSNLSQYLLGELRSEFSDLSGQDIYNDLTQLLQANSDGADIKAVLQPLLADHTERALQEQWYRLSNEEDRLRQDIIQRLKSAPGQGGRGGDASSALKKGAAPGVDGQAIRHNPECSYVPLPGDKYKLDLEFPTFFPDECRMLLKRADAHFMRNTQDSVNTATKIYERIVQRLYYVSDLTSPTNRDTNITRIFVETFEKSFICVTPFSELQGVLAEASTRLARIQLGQDMFGHSPIWAPRLSYFYYGNRITEMITDYKTLTGELEKYRKAFGKVEGQREAVASVRDLIQKESAGLQARLDCVLNENGPLQATAYQVRSYDPKMKEQQRHLKAKMQDVAGKIDSSINVNKLLEAFTTLASSSSQADAAKNSLKAGYSIYQAVTVVEDADGQSFDKALLVKQVKSCGDTLESLSSALATGVDSKVALEDPGAVKVVTTTENITKMLDQFRNVLPESIRKDTNKMLEVFVNTVLTRNNAVMEYNALTQVVLELRSMKKQQATTLEALSEQKLQKVDPNLPFIVNWLSKTRADFAMTIMLYLNYASRAIRFWGLFDGLPLDKPGPLQGAVELENIQRKLKNNFDACLNDYAAKSWSTFGSSTEVGRVYQLGSQELQKLINEPRIEKGKNIFSVDISLSPQSSGMDGIGTSVRIYQARLWLGNAYVDASTDGTNRHILKMNLTHTGPEVIQKDDDTPFHFVHAPVKIQFQYHCGGVKTLKDAKAKAVFGQQKIENDFQTPTVSSADASAIAPLGPFTVWTVDIKESDNPGLDLSKVTGGWLEFWIRSKA
ncbi:hypothetical protein VTL71DRAFT_5567 [Oculimacula yallundae]|uniref:Serine protein kinase n=1 Tax=Oculimacula yallundae TaxID=86028 RepID=A0ABR4C249_9HELO